MTVPSDVNKSGPYFGNGVTTAFNYYFKVVDETHLSVVVRDTVSGVQRTLVLNSDYTVTGVGNSGGGQIITTTAPTSNETLTILRNVPFTQDVDLENQGAYYAETVESALDLMVMRDQQLAEELERSIKLPADADPSLLPIMTEGLHRLYRSADAIDTVAASVDDVETVAANIADVNALGPIASDIADVASIKSHVSAVAENLEAVYEVGDIATEIAALGAIPDAIVGVYDIASDVTTVASIKDDVQAVPGVVQEVKDARDDAVDAKNASQAAAVAAAGSASAANDAKEDAEAARDQANNIVGNLSGGLAGQLLVKKSNTDYDYGWINVSGTGDMLTFVFDPTGVAGDAFDMDNMREGSTNLILTATERRKASRVAYQPAVEPALDFVMSDPAAVLPEWFSRASGGTYFGPDGTIKTASVNEPRIEYDPATGELLGLLVEEQRTNYVHYSQAFDDATWTKTRVSVTPASILSPTGVAYHVTDTTENNTHILRQTLLSQVGDTAYCRWVIVKSDGAGKRLRLYTPTFANWVASGNVSFNLEAGTIVSATLPDGESSGYGMTPLGDGWHLCWIWSKTIAAPTGNHNFDIQIVSAGDAGTYEGDGLTGFYLAAAQVEIGKYPTSYIPTEGAAVTRAADILTVPVSEFPFDKRHGTIFADFRSSRPASAYTGLPDDRATVWTVSDNASGTGSNFLDLYYTNTLGFLGRNGGTDKTEWLGPQPTPVAFERVAAAFDGQNVRVSRNGASVTGHNVPFGLASAVVMRVGNTGVSISGRRVLKGHMRRITYYPAFLSDADLQALTA